MSSPAMSTSITFGMLSPEHTTLTCLPCRQKEGGDEVGEREGGGEGQERARARHCGTWVARTCDESQCLCVCARTRVRACVCVCMYYAHA